MIGVVVMRKGENSKDVLERLNAETKALASSLPEGIQIEPFYDRSILIEQTIDTVWHDLAHGAIFVVVVLVLLLGGIRGAVIAALAIPFSLLGALSFLALSNTSGNLLSLGAIEFGILIDGSVVMVENIIRRLAENPNQNRLRNVKTSAAEVAKPIFFAVFDHHRCLPAHPGTTWSVRQDLSTDGSNCYLRLADSPGGWAVCYTVSGLFPFAKTTF